MPEVVISPKAEQDLLEIWFYIAEDSPVNADRFLDKLDKKAIKLSEFTDIGIDRPELAEDLKSFPVDRYLIYYRVIKNGIELVRVLPGARDIRPLF